MVRPGLSVVFNHEDNGVTPVRTIRKRFNDTPEGKVVIGHAGAGRAFSRARSRQVIVGQVHHFELRHVAVEDKILEFRYPNAGTPLVGDREIEWRIIRAHVGTEFALRHRPSWRDHLAIIAKADAALGGETPQEATLGLVRIFAIDVGPAVRVSRGDSLL